MLTFPPFPSVLMSLEASSMIAFPFWCFSPRTGRYIYLSRHLQC